MNFDINELDAQFGADPSETPVSHATDFDDEDDVVDYSTDKSPENLPEDDIDGFLKMFNKDSTAEADTDEEVEKEYVIDEATGEKVEVVPVPETTVTALNSFHELPDDMEVSFGDSKATIKDIKEAMGERATYQEFNDFYDKNKEFLQTGYNMANDILSSVYSGSVNEATQLTEALKSNPHLTAEQKVQAYQRLQELDINIKGIEKRHADIKAQYETSKQANFVSQQKAVAHSLLMEDKTTDVSKVQNELYAFAKAGGMSSEELSSAWSPSFVNLLRKAYKASTATEEVTKKVFKQTHRSPTTTKTSSQPKARTVVNSRSMEGFQGSEASEFEALSKIMNFK